MQALLAACAPSRRLLYGTGCTAFSSSFRCTQLSCTVYLLSLMHVYVHAPGALFPSAWLSRCKNVDCVASLAQHGTAQHSVFDCLLFLCSLWLAQGAGGSVHVVPCSPPLFSSSESARAVAALRAACGALHLLASSMQSLSRHTSSAIHTQLLRAVSAVCACFLLD